MKIETWNIESMTGYSPITTFYEDLSIADVFGTVAIEDTFKNAFECWKHDYKYITELTMVANWKIWRWYGVNDDYCLIYDRWWKFLDAYCMDNLKDEELEYYIRTTD
jgi:hypothetical protein